MLVITDEARDAIRAIIEESEIGPAGGLRISGTDDEFEFELAEEPGEGDGVIREGGVVVFLDPTAAELLDDKILDAHAHGDHVHFSVDEQ
jgi:Fe-S cluster assembly iron-binding protein IscA